MVDHHGDWNGVLNRRYSVDSSRSRQRRRSNDTGGDADWGSANLLHLFVSYLQLRHLFAELIVLAFLEIAQ